MVYLISACLRSPCTLQISIARMPDLPTAAVPHTGTGSRRSCIGRMLDVAHHTSAGVPYTSCSL